MSKDTTACLIPWRPRLIDGFCVLVTGALILAPGSGFKSAVIWILLLYLLVRTLRAGQRLCMGGIAGFVLAYLVACALSAFFSIDMRFSGRQLVKLIESMATLLILFTLLSPPGRLSRGLRQLGFAMGTIAVADCLRLMSAALRGSLVLHNGRWFESLLGYPTIAAGMYSIGLLILLTNAVRENNRWQRSCWFLFMLAVVALLYWLQTRSVVIGLLGGVFVFALAGPLTWHLRISILVGSVAVMAIFTLLPGDFRERLLSGSLSERQALWADAGLLLEQGAERQAYRRWVGFGYGHRIFEKLHRDLPPRQRQAPRVHDHAHNMMVETRIQTGWIGLITLTVLLLSLFWSGAARYPSRNEREQRVNFAGLAGALIVLLVYAQFSLFFAYLPALMFWVLMAAYLASLQSQPSATPQEGMGTV